MERNLLKVVLDSNIIVSSLVFGGKPEMIVRLVLEENIAGYISQEILTETIDAILKKFNSQQQRLYRLEKRIRKRLVFIKPKEKVTAVRDKDDNKVIEAAVEGECDYIVTGDKDLLTLKKFRTIKIVSPQEFLEIYKKA